MAVVGGPRRPTRPSTRDTLTGDRYADAARGAADGLLAVWPEIERDNGLAQALRACTTALTATTARGTGHEDSLYQPDAHAALYRLGRSLGESGQVTATADHFEQLTETATHHLGPDHVDTLTRRLQLASWRG